jgi:hypothetical protein
MLSGTNDNGMNTKNESNFQLVVDTSGIRALSESAKRTTSATLQLFVEYKWHTMLLLIPVKKAGTLQLYAYSRMPTYMSVRLKQINTIQCRHM